MDEREFVDTFKALAEREGIACSNRQLRQCYLHTRLMLEWNRRVNLSRITRMEDIIIKHFLDSLIPSRWLPHQGFALDLGSGAGFPGIPLKLMHPGLDLVLLEAQRKKASFLKTVIATLELRQIWSRHNRWEDFAAGDDPLARERYSLVTMRAVSIERDHLDHLARTLLAPDGIFAWWAGPDSDRVRRALALEVDQLPLHGCHEYRLPRGAGDRRLLLWRRSG